MSSHYYAYPDLFRRRIISDVT